MSFAIQHVHVKTKDPKQTMQFYIDIVQAPVTFTVQDSNVLPPSSPIYDANPGDIRNARFSIMIDSVVPPGCDNLQPVLVNAADSRTGTIGCKGNFTIPSNSTSSNSLIEIVTASGSYYSASGDIKLPIVIVLPNQTGFITGGGFIVNQSSTGQIAGDKNLKTNFGFNVKTNKSGTNLQGNANIIVRSNGRIYQIKTNSLQSLGLTTTAAGGYGSFLSKCNVTDVTNDANPISIVGGALLTVNFHDNGEPGSADTIGVTVYNGSTLVFGSSWTGTTNQEQLLIGGNLVVH